MSIANLNTGQFIAFHPETGKPLALGRVFFYEPGTTTPKAVYTTRAANVQHPSPLILSATGTARVFMDGEYDIRIEDANGVLVQTLSGVYGALDEGSVAQAIADAAASVTLGFGTQTVTANTTLSTSAAAKLVLVDATGGNVTVTLPAAAGMADKAPIKLLRTDASGNTVTIDGNGAETINGTATVALGIGQGFEIISDASNWRIADGITPFMRTVNRATDAPSARTTLGVQNGAWALISRTVPPAGGPLTFDLDGSLYDAYEIIISGMRTNAANTGLTMQLSNGGGAGGTGINMGFASLQSDMDTLAPDGLNAGSTSGIITLASSMANGGRGYSGTIRLYNLAGNVMVDFRGVFQPAPTNDDKFQRGGAIGLSTGCNWAGLYLTGMQALGAVTLLGLRKPT